MSDELGFKNIYIICGTSYESKIYTMRFPNTKSNISPMDPSTSTKEKYPKKSEPTAQRQANERKPPAKKISTA